MKFVGSKNLNRIIKGLDLFKECKDIGILEILVKFFANTQTVGWEANNIKL